MGAHRELEHTIPAPHFIMARSNDSCCASRNAMQVSIDSSDRRIDRGGIVEIFLGYGPRSGDDFRVAAEKARSPQDVGARGSLLRRLTRRCGPRERRVSANETADLALPCFARRRGHEALI